MTNADTDLIALGRTFDEAARIAVAQIAAIPFDATTRAELAAIEAASGPAVLLAEKIIAAQTNTVEGQALKARVSAWLRASNSADARSD